MYFAVQAGNWDMAKYQVDEMTEIQEVGETTRPNRADMLKAFEDNFLKTLDAAIDAQDKQAFDSAYTAAAGGCNACHTASSGSDWKSYKFIKIQVPTADNNDYIAWLADKLIGNFIANPAPAATATSVPPLTGTIDLKGVEDLVNARFNNVDRSLALWNIQPGLGTVMIEYGRRLAQIVYAIKAGNWDMAKYQLDEALEIQEVGETTRPNRAPMLKAFEEGPLAALNDAILAHDTDKSNTALTNVITGCNACHTGSQGSEWSSFGFIKIQEPLTDPADYIQWNTEGGTGNQKP
jgi:cytochrome c553